MAGAGNAKQDGGVQMLPESGDAGKRRRQREILLFRERHNYSV